MNILYFLVPLALGLAAVGVLGFRWAVRSGQFDDLDSPAVSLFTEPETPIEIPRNGKSKSDDASQVSE